MNCPNCLSLMKCISAINPIPGQPGRERMDLHCTKERSVVPGLSGRGCGVRCNMGVITEDPKEWECHEYGFGFKYKNKLYIVESFNYLVDPRHQHRNAFKAYTTLYNAHSLDVILHVPYFMPISTGDNMHEEAWKTFHRLWNLVIFS